MTRMYTAPAPQNAIVGIFLFLLADVLMVMPISPLYRSLGMLLCAYLAASFAGMPFAYLIVLIAPVVGVLVRPYDWFVLVPMLLSSGLLAMLGLEYGWRFVAVLLSPFLCVVPLMVVWRGGEHRLFQLELPWFPSPEVWIISHGALAFGATVLVIALDRQRARQARRILKQAQASQQTPSSSAPTT